VTVVVSAIIRPLVCVAVGVMRVTSGAAGVFTFGAEDDAVGDTELFSPVLESLASDTREPDVGLVGGNTSCETAITMSERNRARKKRLSIQGTGS
jgi:hypothetical protein